MTSSMRKKRVILKNRDLSKSGKNRDFLTWCGKTVISPKVGKIRDFSKSIKSASCNRSLYNVFFGTMCVFCIILFSLLTLLVVKKTIDVEVKLKSIQKEMDLLKRSNRILKRDKRKFERIVVGVLVKGRINVIGETISDLCSERKGFNTTYVKKIRTMAEEQISKNIEMSKTVIP